MSMPLVSGIINRL